MKRNIRIADFKRLLFPPVWVLLLLTVLCTAALILVFVEGYDTHPAAYGVYALSAYALTAVVLYFATVFPSTYKRIKASLYKRPYVQRFFTDPVFKTHVLLYLSLATNLLYAMANLLFAQIYKTMWFGIFAGYYLLLALMRFLLLRYVNRHGIHNDVCAEWRRARACAYVLVCIILSLSFAVVMMLRYGRTFSYPGLLIYVMAAYTFYTATLSIINLVRYRRHGSPVMSCTKIVTTASALVSMLALETAMLDAFGGQTDILTRQALIGATGFGISLVVILMAAHTILCANRALQTTKETKHE